MMRGFRRNTYTPLYYYHRVFLTSSVRISYPWAAALWVTLCEGATFLYTFWSNCSLLFSQVFYFWILVTIVLSFPNVKAWKEGYEDPFTMHDAHFHIWSLHTVFSTIRLNKLGIQKLSPHEITWEVVSWVIKVYVINYFYSYIYLAIYSINCKL